MWQCSFKKYALKFITPGGTSRGVLTEKETYILIGKDNATGYVAYGECGLFRGLSSDDRPGYEQILKEICERLPVEKAEVLKDLQAWPSIYFGVETLLRDMEAGSQHILFAGAFSKGIEGITINGLIWMSDESSMRSQVKSKIEQGFACIKMKIGAIDFESELSVLKSIRQEFSHKDISIRVDANGAFQPKAALEKLFRLSIYDIHSIEQPIAAKQWQEMARLVEQSPIPIALDEELIGIYEPDQKEEMLATINPPYLIFKPSLIGGFDGTTEWKDLIEARGGQWWITSALESNIGLNAIAQFTAFQGNPLPQGLGTGALYSNNFSSPLFIDNGKLYLSPDKQWNFSNLE